MVETRGEATPVGPAEVAGTEALADWRYLLGALHARFETGDLRSAAAFAQRIAELAGQHGHDPHVDLRGGAVLVRTTTEEAGGVTTRDVTLARAVSTLAAQLGIAARHAQLQVLELCIDAVDIDAVRPFWVAVLGGQVDEDGQVVDPSCRLPLLWFQQMDPPRTQRNRIHFDVNVPHDVADQRIAAALAAGGRMVSDARARAFWILADPEGNEVCVCTWQDRG